LAGKKVDFQSVEELAALLEEIGLTLHAKNRTAGGESNFVWHLAEAIRSLGQLAASVDGEPDLHRLYGDAYQPGSLAEEAKLVHFFGMLKKAFQARK
jgi:hypothetical protein